MPQVMSRATPREALGHRCQAGMETGKGLADKTQKCIRTAQILQNVAPSGHREPEDTVYSRTSTVKVI